MINIQAGDVYPLTVVAKDQDNNVLPTSHYVFISDDTDVAIVDRDGNLVGVAAGTCTITVVARNGATGSVDVTVTANTDLGTNAYDFAGLTDHKASLGDMNGLNALTKLTGLCFVTPLAVNAQMCMFSRYNDGAADAKRQIFFGWTSQAKLLGVISGGGSALSTPTSTASRLTAGKSYKLAFVYDGTQGTVNDRWKMWYSERNDGTRVYPALTADGIDYFGNALPTQLSTPGAVTDAKLGGHVAANSWLRGWMHTMRLWKGQALTEAQLNAEVLSAQTIAPSHAWEMAGNLNDTGSVGGFNGTPSLLVIPAYYQR